MVGNKPNSEASELCRAWGKVRDQTMLIFFDPGAKANFISPELALKVGIRPEEMGYTAKAGLACPGLTEAVTPIIGKLKAENHPHQREITHVLAAAVQACHDMVPPDAIESLLRQLVNQFVHDRARPEVIAVGLNAVREICMRMPLIMTRELLTDLALYKKSREKAVSYAARSIVGIFRQIYPSLLEKRDRGKGADLLTKPKSFGENLVQSNVPGIDLLACEDNEHDLESDEDLIGNSSDDGDPKVKIDELGSLSDEEEEEYKEEEGDEATTSDSDSGGFATESDQDVDEVVSSSEEEALATETPLIHGSIEEEKELKRKSIEGETQPVSKRSRLEGQNGESADRSLRVLKRLLVNQSQNDGKLGENWQDGDGILSDLDFQHIKKLQAKKAARDALASAGIGKSRRKEELVKIPSSEYMHEHGVNPAILEAKIRRRREKEERLASVRAGQEEREAFKARTSVKQKKSGGLSNRQKEKKKSLPLAAKLAKASKSRMQKTAKRRLTKQFRGKKAWK
ncbi:hypothetical protein L7F22_004468 [Adiantum nelumboides]|nr:hypothetical protein [Adiantum nelumboides]